MTQIDVSKLNEWVVIGGPEDEVSVSKLMMYVIMEPGEGDEPPRQGYVFAQKITRA